MNAISFEFASSPWLRRMALSQRAVTVVGGQLGLELLDRLDSLAEAREADEYRNH